ncbi:MAG: hypothetical protein J7578_08460, partial [Chitinophagaceae bacterium]|nr:hypothetical protein [Chitinophagaceae bacterium]
MKFGPILLIFFPLFPMAQKASLPLNFNNGAIQLCVSKDDQMVLLSRSGEMGYGKIRSEWKRKDITSQKYTPGFFEEVIFFNKDTGFASGYLFNDPDGNSNFIYHTINGGKKWSTISVGQRGWLIRGAHLDDGQAWLNANNKNIVYTADYGQTWKKMIVPDNLQRLDHLFFNTKNEGMIGFNNKELAYT